VSVVEFDNEPLVPVIVTLAVVPNRPPTDTLFAVKVKVDDVDAGLGENDPLIPVTSPLADSVTGLEKPFVGVIVTV
jgi:hypothetical protein